MSGTQVIPLKNGNKKLQKVLHKCIKQCVMVIAVLFLALPACADDPSVPTLTKLHNEGVLMADGNVYPESAYTLTDVTSTVDPENLPENVIIKYVTNPETFEVTSKYYEVKLSKTEYGTPSGDSTMTFQWIKDANGSNILEQTSTPDPSKTSFNVNYSTSNPYSSQYTNTANNPSNNITGYFNGIATSSANSGAILNNGPFAVLGNIEGAFIGNNITGYAPYGIMAFGGAIKNNAGTIGNITGTFIGNYIDVSGGGTSYDSYARGGAIYSDGVINDITGDFIGNHADGEFSYNNTRCGAFGGAIYNAGSINDIKGNFIGNYVESTRGNGSAIYNSGTINSITGSFIGNHNDSGYASGGAVHNSNGTIGDITGDFIGNYSAQAINGGGAAISSFYGSIGNITGDFIGNYIVSVNESQGGAILIENATTGKITGNFINNYLERTSNTMIYSRGGAIMNTGTIEEINGLFYNNSVKAVRGELTGGAIHNYGIVGNITGDFIGNYVKSDNGTVRGGAITNSNISEYGFAKTAITGNIKGNFINNFVQSKTGEATGGAIYNNSTYNVDFNSSPAVTNYGKIGDVSANFIGNYAQSENANAYGGAIYNYTKGVQVGYGVYKDVTMGKITGNFARNFAKVTDGTAIMTNALGGAIYNTNDGNSQRSIINGISANFVSNYASAKNSANIAAAKGGAIYNDGMIGNAEYTAWNGYEYLQILKLTNSITDSAFVNNYAEAITETGSAGAMGGAIYNDGIMGSLTADFVGNRAVANAVAGEAAAYGGAIYNTRVINDYEELDISLGGKLTGGIINSNFINNSAEANGATADAKGGAIYSSQNLSVIADNGTSLFSGNYTMTNGVKDDNAIYMSGGAGLTLEAKNSGIIQFDDNINGVAGYSVNMKGDSSGKIIFNNAIKNANIIVEDTNVYVGDSAYIKENNSLSVFSGTMELGTLNLDGLNYHTFVNNGKLTINNVAVDLKNEAMGRITAGRYGFDPASTINVASFRLLNDSVKDKTSIVFADESFANTVSYSGPNPVAYSNIYKYNVDYLINPDSKMGEFVFMRGGASNPSDNYNPAVLPTPVNNQAGGYTTQLQTFNYAFQHSDTFMQIPAAQRFAIINRNKYALSPTGDATDVGTFSPLLTKFETGGIWFKPYASFENIPLKNGPKVNNINYGTLVGFDSNLKSIKHGWERVLTGYIGYNGATQNFSGVTSNQNGGILGTTATFYKGNFFNATTLSVGATAGTNSTMFGSEDYTMLLAGIADKFGYNFEFKEGKYIIQPSMLLSYSFVNTFDYRNAAGVNIQSDPLNALQLAPGIKFIMNTKNGWQPYIGVNMVWNIMDQTKVKANDVRLPSMSIDPYIEYGLGVQRKWGERFMGYAQAMVHNGGRNGISLNGGFRWAIGKK